MTRKKTVYVDDIMWRLKEEVETHPDPEYRRFLRLMLSAERGRSILATLMADTAEKNGIEVKEREGVK